MNAPREHGHRERRVLSLARRLDNALRLLTSGPEGSGIQPHEPVAKVAGGCLVRPLLLDHPKHGPAGRALTETEVTL